MKCWLHHLLDRWASSKPNAPYLYFRGEVMTYGEANQHAIQLAGALAESGVGAGDRVAVMMANRPELVFVYFACFRLGAIAVPVNTRYKQREISHVLKNSGASALIVSTQYLGTVESLCRDGELHRHTIVVDGAKDGVEEWIDYDAFIDAKDFPTEFVDVPVDSPAIMLHTSGSTAQPKGVIHSHRSLYHVARMNSELYDAPNHSITAVYLSALYIGGIGLQLLRNTYAGTACALIENREITDLLRAIREYRCSDSILMPTDLVLLLEHADAKKMDWSSLEFLITGGDKAAPEIHESIHKLTGLFPLEGYGMTECCPITAMAFGKPTVVGSMGPIAPGVQIELRDMNRQCVVDGEIGELWAKSPSAFIEYWNNPQATAATKVDGWINTGDRARRDPDGYYWFEGRSKLIIVRHGSNIAPQEVEEVIDHHPAVMSSCVVGLPDPTWGEKVCAIVGRRDGQALSESELIDYCRNHIAEYKAPEKVIFLDRLPTNSSGKLDRAAMKELALTAFGDD